MDFTASDEEKQKSTLSWTNPPDTDLGEVVVLRKLGAYPTNHADGTIVFDDTSPSPSAEISYVDTGLTKHTTYYYAVYSRDNTVDEYWNDNETIGKNVDTGTTK